MESSGLKPKQVFAQTLRCWFRSNGWPQAITDCWAKDPGIQAPSGPWASQICGAMKADFHPRVEFFMAMARFNQYVADQDLKSITTSKLRDRLKGAKPLTTDAGQLYGAPEFFSLFTGLLKPPAAFAATGTLTQNDVDEWVQTQRDNFKRISLLNMCSRAEAWKLLTNEMANSGVRIAPDDLLWLQEMLIGLIEPSVSNGATTVDERFNPMLEAMATLLEPPETDQ